jgi:hypothetical protein
VTGHAWVPGAKDGSIFINIQAQTRVTFFHACIPILTIKRQLCKLASDYIVSDWRKAAVSRIIA